MIIIKNVWLVAKSEYIKFVSNPRIIILVVMYLISKRMVISPFLAAAEKMNQPIGFFEMPIAVANSGLSMLLIIISYIILMSSFPQINDNIPFCIARTGRYNWILGELLFQFLSSFTYVALIIIVSIFNGMKNAYIVNGWSLVVTDYDKIYGDGTNVMSRIISPELYYQMTPYKAFLMSFLLMFLFILFCSLFFLAGCLYSRRLMFFFIQAAHIIAGGAFLNFNTKLQWLFPFCHSFTAAHYQDFFRAYKFPPWGSVAAFIIMYVILLIIIIRKAKIVSLDMIGGDVLP